MREGEGAEEGEEGADGGREETGVWKEEIEELYLHFLILFSYHSNVMHVVMKLHS